MSFQPSNFSIGLTDFFTILLPGAVVTAVLGRWQGLIDFLEGHVLPDTMADEGWFGVFLFGAFFIGYALNIISSIAEDKYKTRFDNVRERLFGKTKEPIKQKVAEWKNKYTEMDDNTFGKYSWSEARLQAEYPTLSSTVELYQAHSKFFRSMVIVLCLYTIITLVEAIVCLFKDENIWQFIIASVISLALSAISFLLYLERRHKAVEKAYKFVVPVETLPQRQNNAIESPTAVAKTGKQKG